MWRKMYKNKVLHKCIKSKTQYVNQISQFNNIIFKNNHFKKNNFMNMQINQNTL